MNLPLSFALMEDGFLFHFNEGIAHITDLNGYDHIVFLLALCAVYDFGQWKKVIWLVTAFTIGHSLTLFFAGMDWVVLPAHLAEFLIPCTILLTALLNLRQTRGIRRSASSSSTGTYLITVIFGLVHGFGFSNYFRMIRADESESIVPALLSFNLGVELGQIVIVLILLLVASLMMMLFRFRQSAWTLFISGMAAGISLILIQETWIF